MVVSEVGNKNKEYGVKFCYFVPFSVVWEHKVANSINFSC